MATLHLELDIDSDVHPELFVRLASIERSPARQEKLRQLAATGLIWEIARLHGPAFGELMAVTMAAPAGPGEQLAQGVDAGFVEDHAAIVPEDVPMLMDVVDEAEMAAGAPETAVPASAPAADRVEDAAPPPSEPPPPAIAPPPRDAAGGRTRSARIKRMKESGLFQNG